MNTGLASRVPSFGQRKVTPHACIADSKKHIRTFLAETLEELGFIVCECSAAAELSVILDLRPLDLVVMGLSTNGVEAGEVLQVLAERQFGGEVLLIGPKDALLVAGVRQLGEELGINMLPPLAAPYSSEGLHSSVAMLLPLDAPPRPVVDVAEALKAGWLELLYEHKIDARTCAPRGAEALIRMRHPAWGVVSPASFFPDSADPHFGNLVEFVVRRAVDDWRYFIGQQGPVEISINLPISFFKDPASVHSLCQMMPKHPAFQGMVIGINSNEIAQNLNLAIDVARRVRLHNIAVSVDGLGADWPSLMELPKFPFAEIKVDPEFVTGCAASRLKQVVCRRILELANGYRVRTVANGVNSRADLLAVQEMGFDLAQGGLFGKPAGSKKFARSSRRYE